MLNLYEYKTIDGKIEREVVESLQKSDLSSVTGTIEELNKIIKNNNRYDFYINFKNIEEKWFNLIKQKEQTILDIKSVFEEFLTIDQKDEETKRPIEMRLYNLFGEAHENVIINDIGYGDSILKRINEDLKKLEEKYSWLGNFENRPSFNPINIKKEDQKEIITKVRNKQVRSMEDSVADLSKMNTLLMSFVTSIYGVLSDTNKAKIPAENKALIDFAVEKWPETLTRGDRQLQEEGTGLITKLFDREVQIANIIDEVKNVNGLETKEA